MSAVETIPQAAAPAPERARQPLNTNVFDFITLNMMAILAGVIGVCWWAQDSLIETFMHHVELNGIILAITLYGAARVYINSTQLYLTAVYLHQIDIIEANPLPDKALIARLQSGLSGVGQMVYLQNMEMALERMQSTGLLVLTDNDSRLIKSKLGARVRHRYGQTSFFAGILISFGLLGTFVGLIQTVSSVGEQMGLVSASLAAGKEMNVIDLITGISEPLAGMGTAFGASLFGLGGSMILGALSHMSGHAQDHFMEDVSRWLDNHIPNAKYATMEKARQVAKLDAGQSFAPQVPTALPSPVANQQGMSLDMGTFLVLAEDTHKQLRGLGGLLQEMSSALKTQQVNSEMMQANQAQQAKQMQSLQNVLEGLPVTGGQVLQAIGNWQGAFIQATQSQREVLEKLDKGNEISQKALLEGVRASLNELRGTLENGGKRTQQDSERLIKTLEMVHKSFETLQLQAGSEVLSTPVVLPSAVPQKSLFGIFNQKKSDS